MRLPEVDDHLLRTLKLLSAKVLREGDLPHPDPQVSADLVYLVARISESVPEIPFRDAAVLNVVPPPVFSLAGDEVEAVSLLDIAWIKKRPFPVDDNGLQAPPPFNSRLIGLMIWTESQLWRLS